MERFIFSLLFSVIPPRRPSALSKGTLTVCIFCRFPVKICANSFFHTVFSPHTRNSRQSTHQLKNVRYDEHLVLFLHFYDHLNIPLLYVIISVSSFVKHTFRFFLDFEHGIVYHFGGSYIISSLIQWIFHKEPECLGVA